MMLSSALTSLAWVALITSLLWIPYILNMIVVRGLVDAVGYPADPKPLAPWAQRAKAAHYNAVENLVVFAPLVLLAEQMSPGNATVAAAAMVYLWARIVHYLVYTFGIPWLRTLAFFVNWLCVIAIALQLLF